MSADKMSVNRMPVDKISVDDLPVYEMSVHKRLSFPPAISIFFFFSEKTDKEKYLVVSYFLAHYTPYRLLV
jgi:hypothetical protein